MTNQPITALRQRMIEDMTIRRLKERTQDFYQRAVAKYAQHFCRSPAELDALSAGAIAEKGPVLDKADVRGSRINGQRLTQVGHSLVAC
jgi:hypothetical protein